MPDMLRWLAFATVAAGCNFSPTRATTDGGSDIDAALSDADIPPGPRCGSPGVVRGPFVADLAAMGMLPITPTRLTVNNGRLIATAPDAAAVGALIRGRVDLRNSAIDVTAEEVGTADGVATALAARFEAGRVLQILVRNGMLIATFVNGPTMTSMLPYDPAAHRVWRIRDDGGRLIFEASPDRSSWVELLSVASPEWIDALTVSVYITNERGENNGNRAVFAQLNEGTPRANWCAVNSLRDDFADGVFGRPWDQSNSGAQCQVAESNGAAVFTHQGGVSGNCFASYSTRALYDLRSNAVEIAVPTITLSRPNWWAFFTVDTGPRNLTVQFVEGKMCAAGTGFATQCTPYTGAQYWRLAHNGTELAWQVSGDRVAWTTLRTEVVSAGLAAVRISFGARRSAEIDTSITLNVTDYNPP